MSTLLSQDSVTQCGVTTPSAGRKRSVASKRSTKASKSSHIARPPNSFFLFRNDYVKKNYPLPKGTKTTELSKKLGSIWRSLPPAEKLPWEKLAGRLKEEHCKKHPGYKYTPNRTQANRRQVKKSKRSDESSNVVNAPENRNLTPPPPLSPEASFPCDLMRHGEPDSSSIWKDTEFVSTSGSPHPPSQHHVQPYCDPLRQQYSPVPIPGGSTNHSSIMRYPIPINNIPPSSLSFSAHGHPDLHSSNRLGFPPIHSSPPAARRRPSQYDTPQSWVQSSSHQGECFSHMLGGNQIAYNLNSNHAFPPSSQPWQGLEGAVYNPPMPPGLGDVTLISLERCNSHGPDRLYWNTEASSALLASHMNITPTQESGSKVVSSISTQEGKLSQAQSAEAAHRLPSHLIEHLEFDGFDSLQQQHSKHALPSGTSSSRDFKLLTPLDDSFPAYNYPHQDASPGVEGISMSSPQGGVDTYGFTCRVDQINKPDHSFPLHVGDITTSTPVRLGGGIPRKIPHGVL